MRARCAARCPALRCALRAQRARCAHCTPRAYFRSYPIYFSSKFRPLCSYLFYFYHTLSLYSYAIFILSPFLFLYHLSTFLFLFHFYYLHFIPISTIISSQYICARCATRCSALRCARCTRAARALRTLRALHAARRSSLLFVLFGMYFYPHPYFHLSYSSLFLYSILSPIHLHSFYFIYFTYSIS